jgi:hypothetical protein
MVLMSRCWYAAMEPIQIMARMECRSVVELGELVREAVGLGVRRYVFACVWSRVPAVLKSLEK